MLDKELPLVIDLLGDKRAESFVKDICGKVKLNSHEFFTLRIRVNKSDKAAPYKLLQDTGKSLSLFEACELGNSCESWPEFRCDLLREMLTVLMVRNTRPFLSFLHIHHHVFLSATQPKNSYA